MIHKLKRYDIGSDLLEWFEDFLKDKEQRGELISSSESVLIRVSQEAVLGPLLFVI